MRASQAAREFRVGFGTLIDFLCAQGHELPKRPNTKITHDQYLILQAHYAGLAAPEDARQEEPVPAADTFQANEDTEPEEASVDDPEAVSPTLPPPQEPKEPQKPQESIVKEDSLHGVKVVGKIALETEKPPAAPKEETGVAAGASEKKTARSEPAVKQDQKEGKDASDARKETKPGTRRRGLRKRIPMQAIGDAVQGGTRTDEGKEDGVRTAAREGAKESLRSPLSALPRGTSAPTRAKARKKRREAKRKESGVAEEGAKVLKIVEFSSVNDLASLMDVAVNDIITLCIKMGVLVSINQRLDAEIITLIADEYGYEVSFDDEKAVEEVDHEEEVEDAEDRAPIITVMGHVDHGKTSLLDCIRHTKVTDSEKGGITQHIGAYEVLTKKKQKIVFLDMPGHAAFTAMRARGASVTDLAVIVVAADDDVRPQTKEAIDHVRLANVPFVVAVNKMDKPDAQPEKIKEGLSKINVLVEDWGGKYQCQEISAKTGAGVEELLDKVLLESELLGLKANSTKKGRGMVIEASLDKGRGYLATFLLQNGSLSVGQTVLAGTYYGKIRAMYNDVGERVDACGPSTPVQVLGLNGAPQAGDRFSVMGSDKEARELSDKKKQIQREQSLRTKKHITLDEIGRRLSLGSFRCLNLIIKGDADGSVEALADAFMKLTTEEVEVQVIRKGLGGISESDVLLASASDAIIVGFQVRPAPSIRKLAEKEGIDIRLYSVIFDAINEIEDAIQGMHTKKDEEIVTGSAAVKEIFKISKVGNVAGCSVLDGKISRNDSVRIIRESVVVYEGKINQLRREKEVVAEVKSGYECGISIENYQDIKVEDVIEGFTLSPPQKRFG